MIYLDTNENPLGTSPKVRDVLQKFSYSCHRYPHGALQRFRQTIGLHVGVKPAQVLAGAGSTDILRMAIEMLCVAPQAQLVCPAPTFTFLDTLAQRLHVPVKRCPLGLHGEIPLAQIYDTVRRHTGPSVVYLSHPDCYSGDVLPFERLASWIRSLEGRAHVIIDEAYIEFVQRKDVLSMVALVRQGLPHVLVLRTFSKAYGLAGLRVGYGVGHAALLSQLAVSALFCPVNLPAMRAAMEALNNPEWLEHSLWLLGVAREMLTSGLEGLGLPYIAGSANFVLHRAPKNSADFAQYMEDQDICVVANIPDLPGFCRVSIGTPDEVTAYLAALGKLVTVAA